MLLLGKLFQLRSKQHDQDKPFLEHLDDLRKVITRIVITLLVAMLLSFLFQDDLMRVLRRPVDQVWTLHLEKQLQEAPKLSKPLSSETWETALAVAESSSKLTPTLSKSVYQFIKIPDLEFHVKVVEILRASKLVPADVKDAFLQQASEGDAALLQQCQSLLKTKINVSAIGRGDLKMMSSLKPTETFMLSMKLAFFSGFILSFPFLLFFSLQFILPALHHHEKKVLWPSLLIGFGLFIGGVLFAYYLVLPKTLTFFFEYGNNLGVANDWRIGEYISFATQFTLLFGLSFELPVFIMALVKLGLLSYETMVKTRSYAIVGIFIVAAVITPTPDAFTLCLMAVPMCVLYEICIWLAYFHNKKQLDEEEIRLREESRYLQSVDESDAT